MAPDSLNRYDTPYRREEANAPHEAIGNTQAYPARRPGLLRRLFEDLSFAQVVAGAAAAATSVVLASKIGIAGSVIGAAVSSVVTVVSSQVYRHFLTAGAEKLKGAYTGSDVRAGDQPLGTGVSGWSANKPLGTGVSGWSVNADAAHADSGARANAAYAHGWESDVRFERNADGQLSAGTGAHMGARIAPERLRARAKAERASTQRRVVWFSAFTAVAAVVACVAIILLSTAGQGLGTKPDAIFIPASTSQEAPEDTADSNSEEQDAQEPGQTDHSAEETDKETTPSEDAATDGSQNAAGETPAPDTTPSTGDEGSTSESGEGAGDSTGEVEGGNGSTAEGGETGTPSDAAR